MHFSLHSQAPASKAKHCNMNLMLSCSEGSPQRNSNNSLKSCVQIGWNTIKGNVQGSYYANSTWLSSAIAKLNMTIKTKKLNIIWSYLALIYKAEIPYQPPFYHTTSCCQSISFYDTVIVKKKLILIDCQWPCQGSSQTDANSQPRGETHGGGGTKSQVS